MHLRLGDRKLAYHQTGRGPAKVVLVHGGPGMTLESLGILHEMLPEDEFTVLSYNQSGSAGNENAPFYKSVKGYANELRDVLNATGFQRCLLIGHSWGTAVVQEFLASHDASLLCGVVLICPFSSGKSLFNAISLRLAAMPAAFHQEKKLAIDAGDGDALDLAVGKYWFPAHVFRGSSFPATLAAGISTLREAACYYYFVGPDLLNPTGNLASWDRSKELGKIGKPTLLMSGEFDYGTREEFNALAGSVPGAEQWFGKNVSHFPMHEDPVGFGNAFLGFLKRHR